VGCFRVQRDRVEHADGAEGPFRVAFTFTSEQRERKARGRVLEAAIMMGVDPVESTVLLALEGKGDSLQVTARPHVVAGQEERWFDLEITAVGHPFRGTVTDIVTATDLAFWRDIVARLTAPGEVVLGDERAAELCLRVEPQVGGEPGRWVVEASLTPCADDPIPSLRWLIFDQRPFVEDLVRALDRVLGAR
jgi:hypothetical protein